MGFKKKKIAYKSLHVKTCPCTLCNPLNHKRYNKMAKIPRA